MKEAAVRASLVLLLALQPASAFAADLAGRVELYSDGKPLRQEEASEAS